MGKKSVIITFVLLLSLALVNLVPVFAPEIGFDALWYHLTLPKLYLWTHQWYFEGELLYYSAMPRLTETLFTPLLLIFGATGPKMVQYLSGVGVCVILYKYIKSKYNVSIGLLSALIFYGNWLVGWQSSSAYIDLFRTFLETSAVIVFLSVNKLKLKNVSIPNWFLSGVLFGLAVGTKWHALGSVLVFSILFDIRILPVALLASSPWIILSLQFTGRLFYPLMEPFMRRIQLSQVPEDYYHLHKVLIRLIKIPYYLVKPFDDPLSPALSLLVPISFIVSIVNKQSIKLLIYCLFGLISWQLLPPPSTRYLLPFVPIYILIIAPLFKTKLSKTLMYLVWLNAILILVLRIQAVSKFVPVVTRQITQNQFLANHVNRLPDTFIDSDDYFKNNLINKKVLTNIHNLYYFPSPVSHTSFVYDQKDYEYFVTLDKVGPAGSQKIHENPVGVNYFKLQ